MTHRSGLIGMGVGVDRSSFIRSLMRRPTLCAQAMFLGRWWSSDVHQAARVPDATHASHRAASSPARMRAIAGAGEGAEY